VTIIPRTNLPRPVQSPTLTSRSSIVPVRDIGGAADAVAAGLNPIARRAAALYQEERDRDVQTQVLAKDTESRRAVQKIVGEYLDKRGQNAVEARAAALASLESNSQQILGEVANPDVRSRLKEQDAAITTAAMAQIDGHYRRERTTAQVNTLAERGGLMIDDMQNVALGEGFDAKTGRLPDEAYRVRAGYHGTIDELGSLMGWTPEQVQAKKREADTKALGGVAQSLLDRERFDDAAKILETHGDAIEPNLRTRLMARAQKGAEHVRVNDQAFTLAQAISQQPGKSLDEQIAMVDERVGKETTIRVLGTPIATLPPISVEVRDATVERLQRSYEVRKRAQDDSLRSAIADAEAWLVDNPDQPIRSMPVALYDTLKTNGRLDQLQTFAANHRYFTDPAALTEVRAMGDRGELANLSESDFANRFAHRLDPQDWTYAQALRARATRVERQDPTQVVTTRDRLQRAAQQLNILPPEGQEPSGAQQQAFQRMRFDFNDRLLQWQSAHGRKATDAEVAALLDLQVADIVRVDNGGWLGDGWARAFVSEYSQGLLASPSGSEAMPLMNVPKDKVGEAYAMVGAEKVRTRDIREDVVGVIAEDLRLSGKPATFANIAARWVAVGKPKSAGPQGGK